ncbi:hypothetical protein [Spiroplasma sp. AdecLV25b]|uniref:hypothetical protein n=1 Tax=Spiroplasma sp. AdecLV25b TaxID=3027162 RepID=UPI0027E17253|nr:hypothetical protein [Spiroplasma sp. AdecLV25b]
MIQEQSTTSTIGYDHYFLTNKTNDDDSFNQHDWIDLDSKSEMYIYLPDVNNIKDAISLLTLTDSAKTINLPNPISWKQVNNTTYTNNNFITEDTSVGTSSLMDSEKFNQILASNKSKTLTNKEMNNFKKYGSMPATTSQTDQNWWNANGWEKLLNDTPIFFDKKNNKNYSQLDIYQQWISQKIIGMNVPLSLVDENSFTLQTTNLNHVFLLNSYAQRNLN